MTTEKKSPMFELLKTRYKKNFVRIDQLEKYVELGKITQEELEEITGQEVI